MSKFNYLTEEEAKMPLDMALLQIVIGLQSCKTKEEAVKIIKDAVELGKDIGYKDGTKEIYDYVIPIYCTGCQLTFYVRKGRFENIVDVNKEGVHRCPFCGRYDSLIKEGV